MSPGKDVGLFWPGKALVSCITPFWKGRFAYSLGKLGFHTSRVHKNKQTQFKHETIGIITAIFHLGGKI